MDAFKESKFEGEDILSTSPKEVIKNKVSEEEIKAQIAEHFQEFLDLDILNEPELWGILKYLADLLKHI